MRNNVSGVYHDDLYLAIFCGDMKRCASFFIRGVYVSCAAQENLSVDWLSEMKETYSVCSPRDLCIAITNSEVKRCRSERADSVDIGTGIEKNLREQLVKHRA